MYVYHSKYSSLHYSRYVLIYNILSFKIIFSRVDSQLAIVVTRGPRLALVISGSGTGRVSKNSRKVTDCAEKVGELVLLLLMPIRRPGRTG